jgi:hypothetical protein
MTIIVCELEQIKSTFYEVLIGFTDLTENHNTPGRTLAQSHDRRNDFDNRSGFKLTKNILVCKNRDSDCFKKLFI